MPTLERNPRFAELDASRIADTIARLERRIAERFPGSGLALVCHELRELAGGTQQHIEKLSGPIWPLRVLAAIGVAGIAVIAGGLIVLTWRGLIEARGFVELVQGSESAVNQVLLLAMAVFFLVSMETRVKRHRALAALHRLRSIVHIVDMHQLTKDPEMTQPAAATPASPDAPAHPLRARTLSRLLLRAVLADQQGGGALWPVAEGSGGAGGRQRHRDAGRQPVEQGVAEDRGVARGSRPRAPGLSSALRDRSP